MKYKIANFGDIFLFIIDLASFHTNFKLGFYFQQGFKKPVKTGKFSPRTEHVLTSFFKMGPVHGLNNTIWCPIYAESCILLIRNDPNIKSSKTQIRRFEKWSRSFPEANGVLNPASNHITKINGNLDNFHSSYLFTVPQCPFSELLSPTTLNENCCMSVFLMEIMELPHSPPSLYVKWTGLSVVSTHQMDRTVSTHQPDEWSWIKRSIE